MIIGEQRLSETNYYNSDSSHQFEGLKRKLSSENGTNNNFSDRADVQIVKNFNPNNNNNNNVGGKMHFVDTNVVTETYHTYQSSDQIHQDGDQSYINLTVLSPTLVQYDKAQLECHEQQQNYSNGNNTISDDHGRNVKQTPTTTHNNVGKFEVRNYQQHQSGTGLCTHKITVNDVINDKISFNMFTYSIKCRTNISCLIPM